MAWLEGLRDGSVCLYTAVPNPCRIVVDEREAVLGSDGARPQEMQVRRRGGRVPRRILDSQRAARRDDVWRVCRFRLGVGNVGNCGEGVSAVSHVKVALVIHADVDKAEANRTSAAAQNCAKALACCQRSADHDLASLAEPRSAEVAVNPLEPQENEGETSHHGEEMWTATLLERSGTLFTICSNHIHRRFVQFG